MQQNKSKFEKKIAKSLNNFYRTIFALGGLHQQTEPQKSPVSRLLINPANEYP